MNRALKQAQKAFDIGEVPVGAVLVYKEEIIAESHNSPISTCDPSAHAEINVIRDGAKFLKNYRLNNTSLYVTLEPCTMCAGASFWTRIGKIVYGASDERRGYKRIREVVLHPSTEVIGGILENEASTLLKTFFHDKRK